MSTSIENNEIPTNDNNEDDKSKLNKNNKDNSGKNQGSDNSNNTDSSDVGKKSNKSNYSFKSSNKKNKKIRGNYSDLTRHSLEKFLINDLNSIPVEIEVDGSDNREVFLVDKNFAQKYGLEFSKEFIEEIFKVTSGGNILFKNNSFVFVPLSSSNYISVTGISLAFLIESKNGDLFIYTKSFGKFPNEVILYEASDVPFGGYHSDIDASSISKTDDSTDLNISDIDFNEDSQDDDPDDNCLV